MREVVYFFDGWAEIGRILLVGTLVYVTLLVLLRLSGSRTLASMNAFDFVVTVAIGAVFGRTLTAPGLPLAESAAALALPVALQFVVASIQARSASFMHVVTNPPRLLYFRGEFLWKAMRRERVSEDAVRAAVRKKQLGSLDDVEAVVLESSGELSVIRAVGDASALGDTIKEQIRT